MWNPPDTNFFDTVWLIVEQIPEGRVSTYGQIASMIPPHATITPDEHKRLSPRWVGTAMRKTPANRDIPWQRVINSQGKISLPPPTGDKQRQLLQEEGVRFDDSGRVNLVKFGWEGPADRWLDEHNLLPPNQFTNKPKQNRLF